MDTLDTHKLVPDPHREKGKRATPEKEKGMRKTKTRRRENHEWAI
jgi:hypothetical protein